MPERLDPNLFQFHLHLETCPQCRSADQRLCGLGLHLLFHAAQAGEIELVTPIAPRYRERPPEQSGVWGLESRVEAHAHARHSEL